MPEKPLQPAVDALKEHQSLQQTFPPSPSLSDRAALQTRGSGPGLGACIAEQVRVLELTEPWPATLAWAAARSAAPALCWARRRECSDAPAEAVRQGEVRVRLLWLSPPLPRSHPARSPPSILSHAATAMGPGDVLVRALLTWRQTGVLQPPTGAGQPHWLDG